MAISHGRTRQQTPPYKTVGLILVLVAALVLAFIWLQFRGDLTPKEQLTLLSPRSGLSTNPGSKVTYNGVEIGRVVGAGGGFLLVPALVLLGGLPMPAAVGTSLVVIAVQSIAGLAGHLASTPIDWRLAGLVTAVAVIGGLVGARLTAMIEPDVLRQGFGWFVLGMASLILAQEAGPVVGAAAAAMCVLGIAMSLGCRRFGLCPWRRLIPAPT